VVALTVVAFGTSLPELVVVLRAALSGYPGLVLGNVVGSNIANVMLVGGTAAIVCPLTCGEGPVRRDSAVMTGVSILFIVFCLAGDLGRVAGAGLLAVLIFVLGVAARNAARTYREADFTAPLEWVLGLPSKAGTILLFIVVGAVGLPLGAKLVVEAAVEIAEVLGVSNTVVGLTILAASTSLPELATSVMAAVQGRTGVAVGAIIGSNLFNILAIMGVAAVVSPLAIPVPRGFLFLDLPLMLGAAVVLSVFVWLHRPIGRTTGVLLVAGYAAYILALVLGPGGSTR
jgi:cation:H+ antiporter